MGKYMRLAEIERKLVDLGHGYEFVDATFDRPPEDRLRVDVSFRAPEDRSVGIMGGEIVFRLMLTQIAADGAPPSYVAACIGEVVNGTVKPFDPDDEELVKEIEALLARELTNLDLWE
jgi:hypothetical protein